MMVARILDQYGNPMSSAPAISPAVMHRMRSELHTLRQRLKASYDAAVIGSDAFDRHWANADYYSPNSANEYSIRRRLRSRSRYEVIENNPYLKGTVLTVCNDFVGNGPRLQITDRRLPPPKRSDTEDTNTRMRIEKMWDRWCKAVKYRQYLWRRRMAKLVDGESFRLAIINRKIRHPIKLDFKIMEADQVTTNGAIFPGSNHPQDWQTDGIKLDENGNPLSYFVLKFHPGDRFQMTTEGQWINSQYVNHWFRKDRCWDRGIPELTPSLPLCALLRRYTLAVVKAGEIISNYSAVLSSELPPMVSPFQQNSEQVEDDPFDTFPIDQGMFTVLPWGYKMQQLQAHQPISTYDSFVAAILCEIVRPILVPYNLAAGTSKDSNMASAVVDAHIYKTSQNAERDHCAEEALDEDFILWWEHVIASGFVPEVNEYPDMRNFGIEHEWRWSQVGLNHTDPSKVIRALKEAHEAGFITDRDIQEGHYNRNVEDWQEDLREQKEFREEIDMPVGQLRPSEAKPEPESEALEELENKE